MADPREEFMTSLEKALKVEGSYILHVGVWNQNVDFMPEDTAILLPALFVEFMPITWDRNKERGILHGKGEVRFHIITQWQEPADDFAAFRVSQQLLSLIDEVGGPEDNFKLSYPLQTVTNHNHGEVMESIEVFEARWKRKF